MEYQVTQITTYWIEAEDRKEAIALAKTGAFEGETEWEVNV
jgi:hypothetical protein